LRHKDREETVSLGRKIYDEIVSRLPAPVGADALEHAIKRLKLADEAALMEAIARRTITDVEVMEAVMPGSAGADSAHAAPPQSSAISIKGLTPGLAYTLGECCRPIPGDRIVGLRRPGEGIEVHAIDCPKLVEGEDVDWVDLAWGDESEGGTARITVEVRNEPGSLGIVSTIIGAQRANIINLRLDNRDTTFHTNTIDIEVHDVQHLMRVLAALRAADAVARAERA
jgi:(p)ppGpp synthase/HD superfamily hydrolase